MDKKKAKPIVAAAIKVKATGKVHRAPNVSWSHDQLMEKHGLTDKEVREGFVTTSGTFVGREQAAQLAKSSGEVPKPGKKLHSEEVRASLGVPKKKG